MKYLEANEIVFRHIDRDGVDFDGLIEDIRTAVAAAVAPWKAWERAWIFGGEAEWPGDEGTADPRDTVREMDKLMGEIKAKAVAAEREACIKAVCEDCANGVPIKVGAGSFRHVVPDVSKYSVPVPGVSRVSVMCHAAAIRARGTVPCPSRPGLGPSGTARCGGEAVTNDSE